MTYVKVSSNRSHAAATVGIVVNTYNQAHFLESSLDSCIRQTRPADAILVVDDGSSDDPEAVLRKFPGVGLLRQSNAGLAAARNAGLRALDCDYILFLDADDLLRPIAIEAGLDCFAAHQDASMVYGAHRLIDAAGVPTSPVWRREFEAEPLGVLLSCGNIIAMHATVLYRRSHLVEAGAFDPSLRSCEDYDLYLRIAATGKICGHDKLVAEYRHHGENLSGDRRMMLNTSLAVLDRWRTPQHSAEIHKAAALGRAEMERHYCPEIFVDRCKRVLQRGATVEDLSEMAKAAARAPLALARYAPGLVLKGLVRRLPNSIGRRLGERLWSPKRGSVEFGDFDRTRPIGEVFGFDRGTPIDRYYIDKYLATQRTRIRGRVLEIGDNAYTMKFGGAAVQTSDILHIHAGNPEATIVGDLADPQVLPRGAFDCIVLTQTLHLVYDMRAAVANLHAALAPGGALLITVPGISPIEPWEWRESWYWSLTIPALRRLLEEHFAPSEVACEAYGNVFAGICFLSGLCSEEVDRDKLDVLDGNFPITVAARAVKGAAG